MEVQAIKEVRKGGGSRHHPMLPYKRGEWLASESCTPKGHAHARVIDWKLFVSGHL